MTTKRKSVTVMTSPSDAKRAKLELQKHVIRKVFALVIVNEKFEEDHVANRDGAAADKKNLNEFCNNANFTVNDFSTLDLKLDDTTGLKTDNLTADEMGDLFKTISKGDFSFYDAFICFTSSHGDPAGILGVDGDSLAVKSMLHRLTKCPTLVGKPKLFFTQNCRGTKTDVGVPMPEAKGKAVTDHVFSLTVPVEADVLVAYSSVDGYESFRNKKEGSWFITALTKVLKKHVNDMQLTDMLAIVNEMVAGMEHQNGWKQMPCFTSTLRKSVVFKIPYLTDQEEQK